MWSRRAALAVALLAAGCGFTPVYGPGGAGTRLHGQVRVADPQTAGGDDLPDAVRQRLQQARMNAVEAHRKKFS